MKHFASSFCIVYLLTTCGCGLYSKWHYGINAKKKPSSLVEYFLRTGAQDFISDSVFFRPDSKKINDFLIHRIFKDSQFVFLGLFLNDSCYLPSMVQSENNSCVGQIDRQTSVILDDSVIDWSTQKIDTPLSNFGLKRMIDGKLLADDFFDKPVFVFLYAYQYGSYYKKLWKETQLKINQKGGKYKMMFISIDNNLAF